MSLLTGLDIRDHFPQLARNLELVMQALGWYSLGLSVLNDMLVPFVSLPLFFNQQSNIIAFKKDSHTSLLFHGTICARGPIPATDKNGSS